jgi:hypothetical protein
MYWDFQLTTKPIARKSYKCDAYLRIMDLMNDEDFTPDELLVMQAARADGGKIIKGMRYDKTTGKYDGEFSVWRAREDTLAIYFKYKLYED